MGKLRINRVNFGAGQWPHNLIDFKGAQDGCQGMVLSLEGDAQREKGTVVQVGVCSSADRTRH